MSISSHDSAFRDMFEQEATAALGRLASGLLRLEQHGFDTDLVAGLFRDAHNVKGGAAVVGLDDVRRVAHAMEEVLEPIRSSAAAAPSGAVDALLAGVDAIRAILPNAVGGTAHRVDLDAVIVALRRAADRRGPEAIAATVASPAAGRASGVGSGRKEAHTAAPPNAAAAAEALAVPVSRLDELVRLVGEAAGAKLRLGAYITEHVGVDPGEVDEFRELSGIVNELQERTSGTRMVPVRTLADRLHRAVRDVARTQGKDIRWEVRGGETELDLAVLAKLAEPLVHIVRNAVDHGIETPERRVAAGKPATAQVLLHASRAGSEVVITVRDDGAGIDVDALRRSTGHDPAHDPLDDEAALNLIFRSGVSTAREVTEISGRGVGMDAVRTNVAAVRGRVDLRSERGRYTEVTISAPVTLAVLRCLLVLSGGVRYAVPMHALQVALPPATGHERVDGRPVRRVGDQLVPVSNLAAALGGVPGRAGPALVVSGVTRRHAFEVDELLGQRDVVVRGLSPLLPRLDCLIGTSAEPDGTVLLVLDPTGLIDRARRAQMVAAVPAAVPAPHARRILVVDDALTIRELQRSILQRAGYSVVTAGDGQAGLEAARNQEIDLVLTDVEMPKMDGLRLTAALRADERTRGVPIVMLTSRASEEDRRRGLDAGADSYIVKNQFDEAALLGIVE
ncbi:MAG: response regulator, partial [Actinomycetota bacterium]|nr:response regulator [Actinomycetota bacterium]